MPFVSDQLQPVFGTCATSADNINFTKLTHKSKQRNISPLACIDAAQSFCRRNGIASANVDIPPVWHAGIHLAAGKRI
ncbi:hypothetical protein [Jeongeupia sp. USM3]|uniref:hypothetical protein n=1 Tax=Jeongeupia sp. USM3 TaxID=1906741 RepID=UPI0011AB8422|nr:hypothetical protein [Jeongeupia sp. USM3]